MNRRKIKAFEFAFSVIKQFLIITIAIFTTVMTLAAGGYFSTSFYSLIFLTLSSIFYFLSLAAGLFSLMKLTTIMEPDYGVEEISIKGGIAPIVYKLQILFFILGFLFTILILVETLMKL